MENLIKPKIGITMGDPAGIGPEIIVKMLSKKDIYDICNPLVVGDAKVIRQAFNIAKKDLKTNSIHKVSEALFEFGTIDVLDLNNVEIRKLKHGEVSAMCGLAAGESIEKTIELALKDELDGTVTAPIHKEAFKLGGYGQKFPGHTEMYASLTNTRNYSMMLAHGNFRVVHVSTHVSLRQACDCVRKGRVLEVIRIANNACKKIGIENPRVAVAGLNPHCGDEGLFGDEEIKEIAPAILEAQEEGILAEGPIPPDIVFSKASGGQYDIAVAMYHDQGHIPMKFSSFIWDEEKKSWSAISGVNVTLGLPIIHVSVDHGVAFGKAGKGLATPQSLIESLKLAVQMAGQRLREKEDSRKHRMIQSYGDQIRQKEKSEIRIS